MVSSAARAATRTLRGFRAYQWAGARADRGILGGRAGYGMFRQQRSRACGRAHPNRRANGDSGADGHSRAGGERRDRSDWRRQCRALQGGRRAGAPPLPDSRGRRDVRRQRRDRVRRGRRHRPGRLGADSEHDRFRKRREQTRQLGQKAVLGPVPDRRDDRNRRRGYAMASARIRRRDFHAHRRHDHHGSDKRG